MPGAAIEAVVCVPTFRRPDWLARTLASLAAQTGSVTYAIVVIDNDAQNPSGAAVAREFLSRSGLPGEVAVEPEQGNCYAINAAFGLARQRYPAARYFLMIDDDEEAHPDWIAAMVGTAAEHNADIVGGPVLRSFAEAVPVGVRHHPLFGSIEAATGPVPIIHGSGNCLVSRRAFDSLTSPGFDVRFNFLGGGDMDFFTRCKARGLVFYWCAEAIVSERVPAERSRAGWLMKRSLRTGAINYTIDRIRHGSALLPMFKNAASLGLSLVRAAMILVRTRRALPASHPILMSVGRIMASLGSSPAPYRAQQQSAASATS